MEIEIPSAWERLTLSSLNGVVLVIGAPDTGKSTFARYLYRRLYEHHSCVAFVDGDVGQTTLGPPATMTVAVGAPHDDAFPPAGRRFLAFVGDVTPRRHMLPMLAGACKLVRKARHQGASAIVFDTTGLVEAAQGGGALKQAKVDTLRPAVVVGIQRDNELEHLMVPLRRSQRCRTIDLPAAPAARRRGAHMRRAHRAEQFRRHLGRTPTLRIAWQRLAIFPSPAFSRHRLVALEDREGFTLALGIVVAASPRQGTVDVQTPLQSCADLDVIRLGDLALDPDTFLESRL